MRKLLDRLFGTKPWSRVTIADHPWASLSEADLRAMRAERDRAIDKQLKELDDVPELQQNYSVSLTEQIIEEMTYAKFIEERVRQFTQRAEDDRFRALLLGYDHELWTPNNNSK